MKTSKFSLFILFAALLFNTSADAQILSKLKKRVQEATEEVIVEKTAEKAAQETGKAMDSLLDIDPDYEQKQMDQWQGIFAQGGADIPIEDVYNFDTNVLYTMELSSNDQPSVVDYSMWFSGTENYMATQVSNIQSSDKKNSQMPTSMVSVIDENNMAMIVLMEEQQIAQVISMEKIQDISTSENEEEGIDASFESIKKTGNTKKILGYTCEEFTSENDENKMSFWITQELELYQKNMFFNISKSLGGSSFDKIPKDAKGFMMEMNFENLKNNEKGKMVVKKITKEKKSIETTGYQYMNLSQFMRN